MIRSVFVSILLVCSIVTANAGAASLAEQLQAMAPNADPAVLSLAVEADACSTRCGEGLAERLTVIDYSKPSTEPRLWVFDLKKHTLLFEESVAHGKNSGGNMAVSFSNEAGSKKSCLGLFRTGDPYTGGNGCTLQLIGLEPGINDRAYDRAIVIHGAHYVSEESIKTLGRLGRSWGCPVVRRDRLLTPLKKANWFLSTTPTAVGSTHRHILTVMSVGSGSGPEPGSAPGKRCAGFY